jgi:hypothetical protein
MYVNTYVIGYPESFTSAYPNIHMSLTSRENARILLPNRKTFLTLATAATAAAAAVTAAAVTAAAVTARHSVKSFMTSVRTLSANTNPIDGAASIRILSPPDIKVGEGITAVHPFKATK